MERARQVAALWDWLPAFRAVAETQHLPTASGILRVSPSALSRAVRLLEGEIGQTLFTREGRSLVLNGKGASLLEAVRNAMRGVHSALELIENVQFDGSIKSASDDVWFEIVVQPAWLRLIEEHPSLTPEAVRADRHSFPTMLRHGDIDVAVTDDGGDDDQLTRELLADLELALFVGSDHPLSNKARPTWRDVEAVDYVAAAHFGHAIWPTHRVSPRFVVGSAHAAATICHHAPAVTLLPDVVGTRFGLTRVAVDLRRVTPLSLLYRPSLAIPGRTEALVAAIRAVAATLG